MADPGGMPPLQPQPAAAPDDAVTELGTRTRLLEDLGAARTDASDSPPHMVSAFRLIGLDGYERHLGSGATGDLLHVLAERLTTSLSGRGVAYRVGHARFAALIHGSVADLDACVADCLQALSESCGPVAIEGGLLMAMTAVKDIDRHHEHLLLGPAAGELAHA